MVYFARCSDTATVTKLFDPPEGQPAFTYVFDLTGEIRHDRPDMVCIGYIVYLVFLLMGLLW